MSKALASYVGIFMRVIQQGQLLVTMQKRVTVYASLTHSLPHHKNQSRLQFETLQPQHLEVLYYISPEYTPPAVGHVVLGNIKTGFSQLRLVISVTLSSENLPLMVQWEEKLFSNLVQDLFLDVFKVTLISAKMTKLVTFWLQLHQTVPSPSLILFYTFYNMWYSSNSTLTGIYVKLPIFCSVYC